jgi:hypothetical protein
MPLMDHFSPPLNRTHPWRSFHGAWAATIARLLNQGVLPDGYYAMPLVGQEGPVEIDVATLQDGKAATNGLTNGLTWTVPEPDLTVLVDLPVADDLEVQVLTDDGDPRLIAAIELLSPRNKDRPLARDAFVLKCIGYLESGSSVIVVDTVTTRRADLIAEILSRFDTEWTPSQAGLSATAFRTVAGAGDHRELQVWQSLLAIGEFLPTLPLWIDSDFYVPLELETSYRTTCDDLRIRRAD